jgi:hypothetical protein
MSMRITTHAGPIAVSVVAGFLKIAVGPFDFGHMRPTSICYRRELGEVDSFRFPDCEGLSVECGDDQSAEGVKQHASKSDRRRLTIDET